MTGLDTETDHGKAVLIATPRLYTLFPRTFEDCLQFLIGIGDDELICYNGDYDIAACLKFLPPGLLERLYQLGRWKWETRLPLWSSAGFISLHFVPRKFLRVKAGSKRFTIYDLAQFYNMSLQKAAKEFLGMEKKDPGVSWDELKDALERDPNRRRKIIDYCLHDARLVELLARKTAQKFAQIGVPFDRPVSCASLSYRVFKPHLSFHLSREINQVGRESFRGGMIECLRTGYFKKAYYIDLRSAYPAAIRELSECPRLWIPIEKGQLREDATYASVDCTVRIPSHWSKGWLPYVPIRKALLFYPVGRWRSYVDLFSYRQLSSHHLVERVHSGLQGIGYTNKRPFAIDVERLFKERQNDNQKKWAIKIILNSLYGKFAETIDYKLPVDIEAVNDIRILNLAFEGHERFTNHTNFYAAAEVTARTRWRLIEDLDPKDVISYATDGVFLKRIPFGLEYGERLGQWSPIETVRDLVVVGSGVYSYRYQKDNQWTATTKFRGFSSGLNLYELLDRRRHRVPITLQRNQKLGASVVTKNWDLFNIIRQEERVLDVNFDRKRKWEKQWTARELLTRSFESEPWLLVDGVKS